MADGTPHKANRRNVPPVICSRDGGDGTYFDVAYERSGAGRSLDRITGRTEGY